MTSGGKARKSGLSQRFCQRVFPVVNTPTESQTRRRSRGAGSQRQEGFQKWIIGAIEGQPYKGGKKGMDRGDLSVEIQTERAAAPSQPLDLGEQLILRALARIAAVVTQRPIVPLLAVGRAGVRRDGDEVAKVHASRTASRYIGP